MEDTEEIPIVEDEEIFYLWDTNEVLFEVYRVVLNYNNENYSIDTLVLSDLIKAQQLDVLETYQNIPYIHSGYASILIKEREKEYEREKAVD